MPNRPGWIDKLNWVDYWSEADCEAPWTVYLETAWPAIGRAALVLVSFDMGDMARSMFRPAAKRQGRHGRKGLRSGKRPRGIPEPSDLIARNIPGAEMRATRYVDDGTRMLWKFDGFLQRALHRVMLVDLATDFLYEWGSGIVSDPRTNCEGLGRALFVNENHVTLAHGWGSMATGDQVYQQGDLEVHPFAVSLGPGNWEITQAAKVKVAAEGMPFTTVQLGLNREIAATNFLDVSSRQKVWQGGEVTLVTNAHVHLPFGGGVNFREYTSDDPAQWTEITTRVMQVGPP